MRLKARIRSLLAHSEGIRITFLENNDGLASSRRSLLVGNLMSGMFTSLVSGVFLTSLILTMMQDSPAVRQNSFLGSVTMISLATGLAQIVAPMIMERFPRRKKLLLILRAVYHLLNIVILGVIPMLPASLDLKLWLFLGVHLIASLIVQVSSAAFSVWHVSNLPDRTRASYFSFVNMISPMITSLLATGASFFLDHMKEGGYGYAGLLILRGAAVLFAVIEIAAFTRIHEPEYAPAPKRNPFAMLILPFRTPKYLLTVALTLIYSFGANFAGQYFTAYLLEDVGLSYALISGITLTSIPIYLVAYPVWTRVIGRTSWLKTLAIATTLYLTPYLFNAFTTSERWYFYPISAVSAYIFAPGITLVFANLPYMNLPEASQTSYIAFYSTVGNVSGFLSSVAAKAFVTSTTGADVRFLGLLFQNRQFLNFIPCFTLLLTALLSLLIDRFQKGSRSGDA
ncbi:MAG: MFS transporter [Clostridia bacterium]|nr:MFS transporter [Clostridia bacterium]